MYAWLESSKRFKAQIIGKLLGDGGIKKQGNRKPRFQFNHMASDYAWSYYCYEQLQNFLPLNPPKLYKHIDPRLKSGYSLTHYVQSRTSDILCYLREEWYPNHKKIIPFNLIEDFFTPESLAWWYMDDGHLKIKKNIPQKIILSTENFTKNEIYSIITFLKNKYQLPFSVDGQKRIAIYNQFHIHYFLTLISPFTHISMQRKLKPFLFLPNSKFDAKRTTIYLSPSIQLNKPTYEINKALEHLDYFITLYKEKQIHQYFLPLPKYTSIRKSYQIVIKATFISKLTFLKENTGLTFSELVEGCFTYNRKTKTFPPGK